jgi:SAM-dependent methyltransferase
MWAEFIERTRGHAPWPLLVEAAALAPGRTALDLGCGAGRDTRELLERGFAVTAVDASPEAGAALATLPHQERLRFVRARFEDLAFTTYDLVNAAYSLPFIAPEAFDRVFAALGASLGPRGVFCGQLFGPRDTWNTPDGALPGVRLTFHTRERVEALLGGLEVIRLDERCEDGTTALGGRKRWHVYDILARRAA